MQLIKVQINSDGTCTTVNQKTKPVPDHFAFGSSEDTPGFFEELETIYNKKLSEWQKAESERKTYPIKLKESGSLVGNVFVAQLKSVQVYLPGSIHSAIIENGEAVIL